MKSTCNNIRPNLLGDHPDIDPTAIIDPSAQIIGNVKVGKNVFVAPLCVIRADEPGNDGKVKPIILEEECNIQDGCIIHSKGGSEVVVGQRTSVAHGAAIHGPCVIGPDCFIAMRATVYAADLESQVWVGMNATVMRVKLEGRTYVPAGQVLGSNQDTYELRFVTDKERSYMKHVLDATNRLRQDYHNMLKREYQLS